MKTFDRDLVTGSITRSVWKLTWPVILLQVISGVHGFVDQALVGHYVGIEGNAGIGVAWQLFLVIVVFIASLFHGMGVLIARYSGKQDHDSVNRVAYHTFLMSFYILAFVMGPLGFFLTPKLLELTNTSPEVIVHAQPYLRILFTMSTPLFMMFMLNGAFQTSGDPKTPLKLAILTNVINVVLSYILITGPGPIPEMGAIGAALGTCFAPIPSVLIAIVLILRHKTIIGPPKEFVLFPDLSVIKVVARIGIPTGIQGVLLNLAGAVLLAFIGGLEDSAKSQAAYTICYAQLFSLVTFVGFGLRAASATVMGQNIGAGNPERGKAGVYVSAAIGLLWACGFGAVYWFYPVPLLALFDVTDGSALAMGIQLLKYLTFSGLFLIVTLALTGGLQGAGDTKSPMYIAFVTQVVILLGICTIFQRLDRLTTSVIWAAILTSHTSRFILTCLVFYRGKWAHIQIELEQEEGA